MPPTLSQGISDSAEDAEPRGSTILLIAGFGDNASMFNGLLATPLAQEYRLVPLNLPGFGAPGPRSDTTLRTLADHVAQAACECDAHTIVAHSVASIVASLAARQPTCPLETIFSLEGNLTAEDAYFSGTAADYTEPETFRRAFLERLAQLENTTPVIGRYRGVVETADATALWQLGQDANRISRDIVPGDLLMEAKRAVYIYNPDNCPQSTLDWLETSPIERIILDNASHWCSVDQPEQLADALLRALQCTPNARS